MAFWNPADSGHGKAWYLTLRITIVFQALLKKGNQIWCSLPPRSLEAAEMNPHFLQCVRPPMRQHLRHGVNSLHRIIDHLGRCSFTNRLVTYEDACPTNRIQCSSKNGLRCNTHSIRWRLTMQAQRLGPARSFLVR